MNGKSPRTCGRFYRCLGDTATDYSCPDACARTAGARDPGRGKAIIAEVAVMRDECDGGRHVGGVCQLYVCVCVTVAVV